jgi:hypothetical protein
LKLKALLREIEVKEVFGELKGNTFVIEYQKRGLPHAHILVFLSDAHKPTTVDLCNKIVCAEIPDPEVDPDLYKCVKTFMIHNPCDSRSSCFSDGVCSKSYPKDFNENTVIPDDGYVQYRRRYQPERNFHNRRNKLVTNQWVVPYNAYLLKRYTILILPLGSIVT